MIVIAAIFTLIVVAAFLLYLILSLNANEIFKFVVLRSVMAIILMIASIYILRIQGVF